MKKLLLIYPIIISLFFVSCSKNSIIPAQDISNYEATGVLGGTIRIEGNNLKQNKVQVFFDQIKAPIYVISESIIIATIPKNLKRYNPTLRVIDLKTNEDILNTGFRLTSPLITRYGNSEITFNEKLTIYGNYFDDDKEAVEVVVNGSRATIITASSNQLEIYIPTNIEDSDLQIKVTAQLQEVTSNLKLSLKKPILESVNNDKAWIRGQLILNGKNFNPNNKFGEIFLNGVKCHFTSQNSKLSISVPYGPFSDFYIKEIVYKTAGLESNLKLNLEIGNLGVLVDTIPHLNSQVFVYNDKAYAFTSAKINSIDEFPTVRLYEFSPITEKWTRIEKFNFKGYLNQVTFDNNHSLYLHKGVAMSVNELTVLSLNDFSEIKISSPFHESLYDSAFFYTNNNLYVLYGKTYENGQTINSNTGYRYIPNENRWEVIDNAKISSEFWRKRVAKSIFHDNHLYVDIYNETYKINSNLTTEKLNERILLFKYNNTIIGKPTNISTTKIFMYDIFNVQNMVSIPVGSFDRNIGNFFSLKNKIYYHADGGLYNGYIESATFKLKKELLNGIL